MEESSCVTILAEKTQKVWKDPQGQASGQTVVQLVKVVGQGGIKNMKLYGDCGDKNLGYTSWQRLTNDPEFKDRMRSIREVEKYAR